MSFGVAAQPADVQNQWRRKIELEDNHERKSLREKKGLKDGNQRRKRPRP
jgi:hypothetical protein